MLNKRGIFSLCLYRVVWIILSVLPSFASLDKTSSRCKIFSLELSIPKFSASSGQPRPVGHLALL